MKQKKLLFTEMRNTANAISNYNKISTLKINVIENKFFDLLLRFPSVTSEPNYNLPIKHSTVHKIITNGVLPFTRPRRLDNAGKTEFIY